MRGRALLLLLLAACGRDAASPPLVTTTTTTTTTIAATALAQPASLRKTVEAALRDPRLSGLSVGVVLLADGHAPVTSPEASTPLLPASNQKLLTGIAALAVLGPEATLTTKVVRDGDALLLVGGGDPFLGRGSLDDLARQVRAAGITHSSRLVGDESRHDGVRTAPGWFDWHVPDFVGPLSAIAIDGNRSGGDPVEAALALFRNALDRAGVAVSGPSIAGVAPAGSAAVARLRSPPVREMVERMMIKSDNFAAELLLKEVGLARRGQGSTAAGLDVAQEVVASMGVVLEGGFGDGSGLSRLDRRSARELVALLDAARGQPWWADFQGALPIAGKTGTLASRMLGTAAEGNVRAKSGWILEGRALSGYLTTRGGLDVVFSIVVNGEVSVQAVQQAIDDVVVTIASE